MKKNRYAAAVLLAGSLWGFMGFFRRSLDGMGVSAAGCIAVRCVFATLLFGVTILCTDRKAFRIKLRDLWIFFGSGVLSLFTFGVCYFKAMDYMSLPPLRSCSTPHRASSYSCRHRCSAKSSVCASFRRCSLPLRAAA